MRAMATNPNSAKSPAAAGEGAPEASKKVTNTGRQKPPNAGKGRPKGSPNKATAEIKAIAQQYGPEAIATLVEVMQDAKSPSRVAAAKELLDRAYGKSAQPIEGGDPDKPINMALRIAFRRPGD